MLRGELLHVCTETPQAGQKVVDHDLLRNKATGEGTVGLKQLSSDVDSLALHRLTVITQRQFVKVRQYEFISKSRLCIWADPPKRPDDLHV